MHNRHGGKMRPLVVRKVREDLGFQQLRVSEFNRDLATSLLAQFHKNNLSVYHRTGVGNRRATRHSLQCICGKLPHFLHEVGKGLAARYHRSVLADYLERLAPGS